MYLSLAPCEVTLACFAALTHVLVGPTHIVAMCYLLMTILVYSFLVDVD